MRLLELEIDNVRGIPHLLVKPGGANFVIWGPNGSGKSAVVDAIDFLLTGRISRLTGRGTGGITLTKHGPHIDHKPEDTMVRAVIVLPGSEKPVEIKRCMADTTTLECNEEERGNLKRIITLARQGLHVLSRREILRYITADANTRAQEIQELLNIAEIEDVRKTLVKVENAFGRNLQVTERAVGEARGRINATVQEETFREEKVLEVVNQNREVLGGQLVSELRSTSLKTDLRPPTVISKMDGVNITLLDRDIENIRKVTSEENQTQTAESDKQLRELIENIRANPDLLRVLSRVQLIKLGMKMIDETGRCPLCDKPWPLGKLLEYLKQRLVTERVAVEHQSRLESLVANISNSANNTIGSLQKVIATAQVAGLKDAVEILQSWLDDLQELAVILSSPVDKYSEARFSPEEIRRMLAPAEILQTLTSIGSGVRAKYPESTPEQNAWDTLTRLEENLGALEDVETNKKNAELCAKRANIILEGFLIARDKVLGELYDGIRDRFVELYRGIHGDDEGKFSAKIKPDEAGLNFEVDFYGRGTHPPHALHSEGHQDSMGVCLYLALAERLTKGVIDLIILDDVVMSVDAEHRRQVCRLLATSFPDRQFLITTHDRTWANQLKSEGVVKSQETIQFYNWCIEMGPQVDCEVDMWKRIEEDLQKEDVPSAAGKLRRGSEEFFGMVCDALQAQVTYKLNGRWELGDFLPAAMGKYHTLLKKAKKTAQSWGDENCCERLQELDSTVGQIYTRCGAEQWAINANVHYNNWANFSKSDFRPIVEAFQDLYGLFICSKCGGMLHLTTKGLTLVAVRCNCGGVDWNLIEKAKTN
jgi:DNA repair exonuclease SbcCD ATPase subunit